MEEWKAIPGYEGYFEASTEGRIRSVSRVAIGRWGSNRRKSHVLTPNTTHHDYQQVKFSIDGKKSQKLVHRLVAMTFIPNPDNLPQVNHKDGNGANNAVNNLEWCTASDNCLHRNHVLHKYVGRAKKPVKCVETGEVFESSYQAARVMNFSQSCIYMTCQGKLQKTGGYHFEFV